MADNQRAWTGWITFAGVMMLVVATINIFEGIVALVNDKQLVVEAGNLFVVDVTGWGWTLLISGALVLVTGLGLMSMRGWARIAAIVVVGLHAVSQVAWLGAYPVWSLLMIALDTTVLFALTARWPAPAPTALPAPAGAATAPAAETTPSAPSAPVASSGPRHAYVPNQASHAR